jgi:hypothetical protein
MLNTKIYKNVWKVDTFLCQNMKMHLINLKLDTKHPLRYREGTTGYEKTGSPLSKIRDFGV